MSDATPFRPSRRDPTREERLEVLRLLEGGDISADEASTLLDALEQAERAGPPPYPADVAPPFGGRARQVRVRITDAETGRATVNLALPVGLFEAGLGIARRFAPDFVPDADTIRQSIVAGFRGPIVDIDDGGEHVEIIVE